MTPRLQPYHARIPPELAARLAALAAQGRRSSNAEVILAVEHWLAQQVGT